MALWLIWGFFQPVVASRSIGFKIIFAVFFAGGLLVVVGALMISLMLINAVTRRDRGVLGEHVLEITDEGLVERTEYNEGVHRWAGLRRIVANHRFLIIFVTDSHAHAVPWHFFATPYEATNFQREIEDRMRRARDKATPV